MKLRRPYPSDRVMHVVYSRGKYIFWRLSKFHIQNCNSQTCRKNSAGGIITVQTAENPAPMMSPHKCWPSRVFVLSEAILGFGNVRAYGETISIPSKNLKFFNSKTNGRDMVDAAAGVCE